MSVTKDLQQSVLFSGLADEQIQKIAALGQQVAHNADEVIIREGEPTDDVYIVCRGMVEVETPGSRPPNASQRGPLTYLIRLGQGQVFGEMSLVDQEVRSATVRCVQDDTVIYAIPRQNFWDLCDSDHQIGYIVVRNIAADLSFKLRLRNLPV